MTDRDRLIELILNRERVDLPLPIEYQQDLADYLLANGVILPPCKVGDILFCIFSDKSIDKVYTHIETCRVTDIKYFASDSFVFGVREINRHYNHNVVLGENAFKTFEEAEAELKKRSKENEC
jgi:hypothetical protein